MNLGLVYKVHFVKGTRTALVQSCIYPDGTPMKMQPAPYSPHYINGKTEASGSPGSCLPLKTPREMTLTEASSQFGMFPCFSSKLEPQASDHITLIRQSIKLYNSASNCLLKNCNGQFFIEKFQVHSKIGWKAQNFLISLQPQTCTASHTINIPHLNGAVVATIDLH